MLQLYQISVKTIEDQVENSHLRVIESVSNNIDSKLSNIVLFSDIWYTNKRYHQILNPAYLDYIKQFSDYVEIQDSLEALLSYYNDNIIKVYLVKDILLSAEFNIFYPISEISDEKFYQEIISNPGGYYWNSDRKETDSFGEIKDVVSVFRPIYDLNSTDKKLIAIIEAAIPKYLLIEKDTKDNTDNYIIISDKGSLIAGEDINIDMSSHMDTLSDNETGIIDIDGRKKVYYSKLKSNLWYVISVIDNQSYLSQINKVNYKFIIISISVLLVLLFLSYIMTKTLNVRINSIIEVLAKTVKENFNKKIEIQYSDELTKVELHTNLFIEHIQQLMSELKQSHIAEKEAEMDALQAQINPHFLYNTLDSINWMAIDSDNMKISDITTKLGDFLRLSLSGGEKLVSISQEIEHCKLYIDIQQIRTNNSLTINFEIEDQIFEYKIIKFILQPIIENAIIHGFLESNLNKGEIIISGYAQDNHIIITIKDNGIGFDSDNKKIINKKSNDKKIHYGIKNIKERLYLQYGNISRFKISSKKGYGTTVEIKIPIEY